MTITLKATARLLLFNILSLGSTLGNTVSLSPSATTGKVDESLELTCQLTPTSGATTVLVKWFLNGNTDSIQRSASSCNQIGLAPSYDLNRYSFTCNSNTFKLKILGLKSSDNGQCWSCSVTFTTFPETAQASSVCINVQVTDLLLLLLLLILLLPLLIFIILICCGCLDCCKCCRIFDNYNKKKCCYVTCYCLEKGCCSFFYCRPGSKRGKLFCGQNGKDRCEGCTSCQKNCGCGWPGICKINANISCGCCSCVCCVKGLPDEGLAKAADV